MQGLRTRRLALLFAPLTLAAAAPPAAEYPLSDVEGEALMVPAASPVAFSGFEEHIGRFRGQFDLTGTLVYRCSVDCDVPMDPRSLTVFVIPDVKLSADLPYWKARRGEIHIYFENDEALADAVIGKAERQALLSGKLADVRKRVALKIDDFHLGIDCDSASYTARFVSLARPPVQIASRDEIDSGCS